ncbi:cyclase family protein [Pauljensenia sp. UMB10120]|uniref:cyclase family protein n=1 Tax=Pauljensenia sp. UMB10120 TaxID=3046356 RepID=UPI003306ACB3
MPPGRRSALLRVLISRRHPRKLRRILEGGAESIPIIDAPGVLLDVAARSENGRVPPRTQVTAQDLEDCARDQRTHIEPGSVIFVRLGNDINWDNAERHLDGPGIHPSASQWLATYRPIAVGTDNVAWDLPGLSRCRLGGSILMRRQVRFASVSGPSGTSTDQRNRCTDGHQSLRQVAHKRTLTF